MLKWVRNLGLIYQIGIVVLIGFAVSFFLSMHLLASEKSRSLSVVSTSGAVQRVLSVIDILSQTPDTLHPSIIAAGSSSDLSLSISSQPQIEQNLGSSSELAALTTRFTAAGINTTHLALVKQPRAIINMSQMHNAMMSGMAMPERNALHRGYVATIDGSVQLSNHQWLNFSSGLEEDITHWSTNVLIALSAVMLITLALSLLIIHRALHPVRVLGQAAREFAIKRKVTPISDNCPDDLLPTITAFNQMQIDIASFIEQRTRLLAAISHDLRTPLTTLRLRLEFIEDSEDKQQMLESITIMEKMLKATMSFAKEDSQLEERQPTAINAFLQTIADEYADKNISVHYQPQQDLVESIPPIAVRRMIENLVNNSAQYGGESCDISLSVRKKSVFLSFRLLIPGLGLKKQNSKKWFNPLPARIKRAVPEVPMSV